MKNEKKGKNSNMAPLPHNLTKCSGMDHTVLPANYTMPALLS